MAAATEGFARIRARLNLFAAPAAVCYLRSRSEFHEGYIARALIALEHGVELQEHHARFNCVGMLAVQESPTRHPQRVDDGNAHASGFAAKVAGAV
ncbi:MAG: hypothetical protein JOY61_04410 [Chloroflexi bacterium]|nr:hypothetical protein [Chloroflexota bacterium]